MSTIIPRKNKKKLFNNEMELWMEFYFPHFVDVITWNSYSLFMGKHNIDNNMKFLCTHRWTSSCNANKQQWSMSIKHCTHPTMHFIDMSMSSSNHITNNVLYTNIDLQMITSYDKEIHFSFVISCKLKSLWLFFILLFFVTKCRLRYGIKKRIKMVIFTWNFNKLGRYKLN